MSPNERILKRLKGVCKKINIRGLKLSNALGKIVALAATYTN